MAILLKPGYQRRAVPTEYDRGFFEKELSSVQRAIPSLAIQTVVSNYTPTSNDHTILCDCTSGTFSILLPPADQAQGLLLAIKKIDASANAVTLHGTIDGAVNPTLATQYASRLIHCDGTQYLILASV